MKTRCLFTGLFFALMWSLFPLAAKSSDIYIVVENKVSKEKIKNALVTIYQYSETDMRWKKKIYEFTDSDGSITILDLDDWEQYIIMVEAKGFMKYLYKDRLYFQAPDILTIGNYGLRLDMKLIPLEPDVR